MVKRKMRMVFSLFCAAILCAAMPMIVMAECSHVYKEWRTVRAAYELLPGNASVHFSCFERSRICLDCGETVESESWWEEEAHSVGTNGSCTVCGYIVRCNHTGGRHYAHASYYHTDIGSSSEHEVKFGGYVCCDDCDNVLDWVTEKYTEPHSFNGSGTCTLCGYQKKVEPARDEVNPKLNDIACSAGTSFSEGTLVTFSTKGSDNKELDRLILYIDGEVMHTESQNAGSGVERSISYTTSALSAGSHTVLVEAWDLSSNVTKKSLVVTVTAQMNQQNTQQKGPDSTSTNNTSSANTSHTKNVARPMPYTEGCPLVSCGFCHTILVKNDGTVKAYGENSCGECNVSNWREIVQVEAGTYSTIGLKSDGTVVFTGDEPADYVDKLNNWRDIKRVSAGAGLCLGLTESGEVVAAVSSSRGNFFANKIRGIVEGWHDIVQVSAGAWLAVGLQKDGTITMTGISDNGVVRSNYGPNPDAIQISAGNGHFLVLNRDGTVDGYGTASHIAGTEEWTDIVQVVCGYDESFGLRSDGTVIKAGHTQEGNTDVSSWRDVVMLVQTCGWNLVGIRSDGKIYYTGRSYGGAEIQNETFEGFQIVEAWLKEPQQETDDVDSYAADDEQIQCYGVITGNQVPMYQKTSAKSRIVDYLENGDVVYIRGQEYVNGVCWHAVTNEDNREGYVQENQVRMMTIVEEEKYLASPKGNTNAKQDTDTATQPTANLGNTNVYLNAGEEKRVKFTAPSAGKYVFVLNSSEWAFGELYTSATSTERVAMTDLSRGSIIYQMKANETVYVNIMFVDTTVSGNVILNISQ